MYSYLRSTPDTLQSSTPDFTKSYMASTPDPVQSYMTSTPGTPQSYFTSKPNPVQNYRTSISDSALSYLTSTPDTGQRYRTSANTGTAESYRSSAKPGAMERYRASTTADRRQNYQASAKPTSEESYGMSATASAVPRSWKAEKADRVREYLSSTSPGPVMARDLPLAERRTEQSYRTSTLGYRHRLTHTRVSKATDPVQSYRTSNPPRARQTGGDAWYFGSGTQILFLFVPLLMDENKTNKTKQKTNKQELGIISSPITISYYFSVSSSVCLTFAHKRTLAHACKRARVLTHTHTHTHTHTSKNNKTNACARTLRNDSTRKVG